MSFTTLYSVCVSCRYNNEAIFAKVVEINNKLYFDLRLFKNDLSTKTGIFIDCVEFVWFQSEIKNLNRKSFKDILLINNERKLSIDLIDTGIIITLEKINNKSAIAIKDEEVDILIKELENIAKVIKNETNSY
jgi:hypothetical protein